MEHKSNVFDKALPDFLSEGVALRQGDWSSDVKRSPEALKWCRTQLKRCDVVYKLRNGETDNFEGFPQWTVEVKEPSKTTQSNEANSVKSSDSEHETLFMIGRVRKPWEDERGFDAVVEVAFRGTVNVQNWVTNLSCVLGPTTMGKKQGQVHSGFARAYDSLQPDMMAKIELGLKAIGADWSERLLVQATGHSMGAALATLASYDLGSRPGCTCICTTFAGPRVGDSDFVRSYNEVVARTLRFVNKFDPVPKLPPSDEAGDTGETLLKGVAQMVLTEGTRAKTYGYRHTSPQIELDEGKVGIAQYGSLIKAASKMVGSRVADQNASGEREPAVSSVLEKNALIAHGVNEYVLNFDDFAAGRHVQKGEKAAEDGRRDLNDAMLQAGSAFANWWATPSKVAALQQETRQQQTDVGSKDWETSTGSSKGLANAGAPKESKEVTKTSSINSAQTSANGEKTSSGKGWGTALFAGAALLGTVAAASTVKASRGKDKSKQQD